jgi:phosphoglycolate phosphatase
MAVLTNKPVAPAERLLDAFGLRGAFRDIVGGDMTFARKPDPEGLRHLMTSAGVEAGSTLMVGDSMIDIDTARAAGARACLARYGFGHLRGPVALTGDEPAVDDVPALATAIDRFLSTQGRAE